jgi:deoxyribonuclease V
VTGSGSRRRAGPPWSVGPDWPLTPADAIALQRVLADRVILAAAALPDRVVGLDCAFTGDEILAVAVVWDTTARAAVETRAARMPIAFPYVPGLLSFREVPVLLAVLNAVRSDFGGVLCDGQGIAHPRRLGLASHLGLLTDLPTVGCAKSRLCGEYLPPGERRGDWSPLHAPSSGAPGAPERIGTVLRTRDRVNPLFVSPGHRTDHASSIAWVLACGAGYRLPEPTRLADRLVAAYKRTGWLPVDPVAQSQAPRAARQRRSKGSR